MQIPKGPRRVAVAEFRLTTGHDCLAKHLCRIGIQPDPYCPLCFLQVEMDREHLQQCPSLKYVYESDRYWEARDLMRQ